MTLALLLEETRRSLAGHGIEEATLEADLFLMKALGLDRAGLYSSPDRVVTPEERQTLARDLARRLNGEPWPYIGGYKEFYGLNIRVSSRVFIPRPGDGVAGGSGPGGCRDLSCRQTSPHS